MPTDVAAIHEPFSRQLSLLYAEWNDFKVLFRKDRKTIQLLNDVAPFFFLLVHELLRDHIILSICKLTEKKETPVKGVSRKNLTVEQLIDRVQTTEARLVRKLRLMAKKMKESGDPFREHRNRRIGHADLDTHLKLSGSLLPGLSLHHGNRALGSIAEILNEIEWYFNRQRQRYKDGTYGSGNGQQLIEYLEEAERLRAKL